jgi:hypothetical protein
MKNHDETLDQLEMKMADWHQWWQINGDHLECVKCKACQWPWNAAIKFSHDQACANSTTASLYPWKDLATIIR